MLAEPRPTARQKFRWQAWASALLLLAAVWPQAAWGSADLDAPVARILIQAETVVQAGPPQWTAALKQKRHNLSGDGSDGLAVVAIEAAQAIVVSLNRRFAHVPSPALQRVAAFNARAPPAQRA